MVWTNPNVTPDRCHGCRVEDGEKHKRGCKYARIPEHVFIAFPPLCAKCGIIKPDWFWVRTKQWQKIKDILPNEMNDIILCYSCYRRILKMIRGKRD